MTWRMARSLDVLLAEVNVAAPRRSKVSDGGIGDAAHATRASDHNPWIKDSRGVGVVRARDFTDDPPRLSAASLAAHVASMLGQHPALRSGAYVIWDHRIISTDRLSEGWRPYSGANAHTKHVHISVGLTGYDVTEPWGWPRREDWFDMATKDDLRAVVREEIAREFDAERKRDKNTRIKDRKQFKKVRDLVKDNAAAIAALDALGEEA